MNFQITRRKFLRYSGTLAGALAVSPGDVFSKGRALITFGIVTDSHYADREPVGTRYFRESLAKMKEAIAEMNKLKVSFVVHLGDFKDQDENPTEESTLSYLRKQEEVFAAFNGPRYHVLGNHDTDSISKQQFLENILNTGVSRDKSYYSFDQKGFHFIVLDADYRTDGASYEKGNFEWTDTFIPDEQLKWLKDDLNKTMLPTVVFVHQLLDDVDDADFCVKNAGDVRSILQGSEKVLAVFQGHRHKDRYNKIENIHYCTLPGMVDFTGDDNNSFSVVEISESGNINLIGYERAPNRHMKS